MRLAHHRRGTGEPLVLVHGIGSHWQVWRPVLGLLARERDVIAIDLPGFGASLMLRDEAPTLPALADAVTRFAAGLGLDSFHVAGNSLGGAIALELGRRGTARSVCALSPAGFYGRPGRAWARGVLQSAQSASSAVMARPQVACGGPLRRSLAFGAFLAKPWRMTAQEAEQGLLNLALSPGWQATRDTALYWSFPAGSAIGCPVTIAWAQRDRVLLRTRQAARARELLPAARHLTLTGCGHVPMTDDPLQVARVLLDASAA